MNLIYIYRNNNPIASYSLNGFYIYTKRRLRVHEQDRLYSLTEGGTTLLEGVSKLELDKWLNKEFPEIPIASPTTEAKDDRIDALVQERSQLRQQKRFAEADRIRDELKTMGVTVVDRADGSSGWIKI